MTATATTFIRDMSHYDDHLSLYGYAGTTHKITEGRGYVDPAYAARMPGFRAPNLVLGSYHVLHTADPAGQLQFWIEQQDKLTPWWRDWPHWIMQIDAEKWPADSVPPSTVVTFARMLKSANLPGLQVCYASRGQYGDSLAGIPLELWNAAYHSSTYPGNDAVDWRPYSGRTPLFWQYTSTPYDKNAFRGTVAELLAHIEGGDMPLTPEDVKAVAQAVWDHALNVEIGAGRPANPQPAGGILRYLSPYSVAIRQAVGEPGPNSVVSLVKALNGTVEPPVITQQMLDLAVLNALKTLAGGQPS